ncbi:amyloid-beta A4 precursor protein-binding family A member 2 isoform X1 [Callorhinchus milii]|uniref:amyloid-beta A4 precursor protein-binding family A member 2 isoform X1 n=1 Tax=Callorhinchus milii TaxID=7868 RepID=UPI001C3F7151|nr:amyloid-beta A4 precursor protein-binding family A member 2 isoform X1 [Callorhinchus milii]XP_007907088.2 amyloid-beta A4 precursor protein-binding family A member 2 isoform X1 [Callorhinchus milii]XP_007907095.2 amyloid-beta A4 precursor protein-binding family A member 2 isoform X1 [Callorhinchus milii]
MASSALGHEASLPPSDRQEPEQEDPRASAQGQQKEVPLLSREANPVALEQDRPDLPGDGDSSSDYVNSTSEEEDYDEGLPEEEEGVTYYIRYCPEEDSYLEDIECAGGGYGHGALHSMQTDHCQEATEESWDESNRLGAVTGGGSTQCLCDEDQTDLELSNSSTEPTQSGDNETCSTERNCQVSRTAGLAECPVSTAQEAEVEPDVEEEPDLEAEPDAEMEPDVKVEPNREAEPDAEVGPDVKVELDVEVGPHVEVEPDAEMEPNVKVEPEVELEVEDQEEDIDQIVSEIQMSMSISSLTSLSQQSPEEAGGRSLPSDCTQRVPNGDSGTHHISGEAGHMALGNGKSGEATWSESTGVRADVRRQWNHGKVPYNTEQPRKQQRSDLNAPVENNNVLEQTKKPASFPNFVDGKFPGPCEPEDLIDGIIFAANYLGSTQLLSERNPSKNIRMVQAQEAVSRIKRLQKAAKTKKKAASEGALQPMTEVDLFISTQRIKMLNADSQEPMMDHALRTISYIADIGNIVVLMARRRMPRSASQDCIETTPGATEGKKQYKMICHVFESEDAQLIAQSIGQAFSVAYQEFLRANGINPEDLSQKEYSDIINTQEMYNDDLVHFSNSENCKELQIEKQKGEMLGVVIVESGWGSILPTVILANMMNVGPAARSGKLSIGDQIMSINGTSLVGLPLATCQGIIKGVRNQTQLKLNIVSCPPVTTVLIKRPDLKYQLGFSVQNGIICSLMRGGIAERGGVRVGHRIIEINGQSVVATAHEKIVQALSNSVGEIHMRTMPAAMFRLLTGQDTPLYI